MNLWSDKGGTCATCQHWGNLYKTANSKEGCKLLKKKFNACSSACFLADLTTEQAMDLGTYQGLKKGTL